MQCLLPLLRCGLQAWVLRMCTAAIPYSDLHPQQYNVQLPLNSKQQET
jgi:hypothetical protein